MNAQVMRGDNLTIMAEMTPETIDLIYADPPFATGKDWGEFDDRWEDGIDGYLDFMFPRLSAMRKLLKPTGSLYLHCDPTASHYLKLMMDDIFGKANFRNEIVWCYRGGGVPRNAFARKHDVILFYTKTGSNKFSKQFRPYSEASTQLVKSKSGRSVDGKVRDLDRGASMEDWWSDINSLQTWSAERTGYPTQKPLALLERIIKASSNTGDIVLDPFCGSGTSGVAAVSLGRCWIGIDSSSTAVETTKQRLGKLS